MAHFDGEFLRMNHYGDVITGALSSQITGASIFPWTVQAHIKEKMLRFSGFRDGNSQVTGEFALKRDSNAENVSIWWRHHSNHRLDGVESLRNHATHDLISKLEAVWALEHTVEWDKLVKIRCFSVFSNKN